MYIPFIILTNLKSFYSEICLYLSEKFNDKKIIDLGIFLSNAIIDSSYDPAQGRTFDTQYNWLDYFQGKLLESGGFNYIIDDQEVYTNGRLQSISWNQSNNVMENKEQFVYKQLGDITISKLSRTIRLI
jgi:hypothetical protein